MANIILIGMPGAGKSTVGVILAKALKKTFIDTDLVVQEDAGRLLQEIIDTDGPGAFLATEERTIVSRHFKNAVVATGGSVVFSRRAMEHLKSGGIGIGAGDGTGDGAGSDGGVVVYLKISFEEMEIRLRNITTRGIVLVAGQSLREMYDQRVPLYERYADRTIECSGKDFEAVVAEVIGGLPGT